MSTLNKTNDLIIDREPPFDLKGPDIAMSISQIMICLSLTIGTPLNFVPARTAIFEIVGKEKETPVKRIIPLMK